MAQDGMIVVENVFYHKNAALATSQTVEADWERRGMYGGPPFGNLDEDLQVLFERYLDERGINTSLALVIPDYIDFKEQKEYLSWLQNVKGFVAA
jgi:complement component 1 Q subcomponent-binding protein